MRIGIVGPNQLDNTAARHLTKTIAELIDNQEPSEINLTGAAGTSRTIIKHLQQYDVQRNEPVITGTSIPYNLYLAHPTPPQHYTPTDLCAWWTALAHAKHIHIETIQQPSTWYQTKRNLTIYQPEPNPNPTLQQSHRINKLRVARLLNNTDLLYLFRPEQSGVTQLYQHAADKLDTPTEIIY